MTLAATSEAARIRARLSHPIVDADGHMLELDPIIRDYMRQIGGSQIEEKFFKYMGFGSVTGPTLVRELIDIGEHWWEHVSGAQWFNMTPKERRDSGTMAPFWWFLPIRADYRATSHLPKLFHDRMDEFGLDFGVLFPTLGVALLALPGIHDEELRRVACRAYNMYCADMYGEFADRLTPAAAIPMHNPTEALAELDYAVRERGLKVTIFPSYIIRPIEREPGNERVPEGRLAPYKMDLFGIDSDYDYDPVWQKCVELGVSPCFHSTANGIPWGPRNSPTNLMYNTVGNFAESGDAVAKALFIGGVTRRFPTLRFGLLEGGAGRGALLYANMEAFWHKRNPKALRANNDPSTLDLERMSELIDQYGNEKVWAKKDEIMAGFAALKQEGPPPHLPSMDDWEGAQIERPEQFKDLFQESFFYGCEADDPTVAWAFDTRILPHGAKIRPFMGSDISHADVIDPLDCVPEAYELVEHHVLTEEQFKEFVFTNAVRLYAGPNPNFFKGTPVEAAAAQALAEIAKEQPAQATSTKAR